MEKIVNEVIKELGGINEAQRKFKYSSPVGIYNWRIRGLPKSLIAEIHMHTGIDIKRLQKAVKAKAEASK